MEVEHGVGTLLEVEVGKIHTTPARQSDLEVKPLKKNGMIGALLEVDVAKNCTRPARENDLEVKTV